MVPWYLALHDCKRNSNRVKSDLLATKLLQHNDKTFWKEIKKLNGNNSSNANTVNGCSGAKDITEMWQHHYKCLLNSSVDTNKKTQVLRILDQTDFFQFDRFTVSEVHEAINKLKNGKSAGLDNIYGEHFKLAHPKICILLCIVFNAMLIHSFLPDNLMNTIIVPLIKDRRGDITNIDNYRPLAITCVASKIFEIVILNRYQDILQSGDSQFGFKKKHATDMCVFSLQQIMDYYTSLGSPVYICYLDASKAFDKINHWNLFLKLLDKKLPHIIVRFLVAWYTTQTFIVQWGNTISCTFEVSNGVRQGGILSPFLFNVYVEELANMLKKSSVGCNINNVWVNHLFYADDAVILAPSPCALQKLIDICVDFASKCELTFNTKKSVCMCVKPKWLSNLVVPRFTLGGKELNLVSDHKYLGVIIQDNLKNDLDISDHIRKLYARGNTLIRRFAHCSDEVKLKLLKSYCTNFYCCYLWSNFNKGILDRLVRAYNRIFKNMMKLRDYNVTAYMVELNVDSVPVIIRKLVKGFRDRVLKSENCIINTIVSSVFFNSSNLNTRWYNVLF